MSGVLAVVALGLYMGKNGKTRISPEVEHFLEGFWEMLAFFGNTLVFVISGIVIFSKLEFSDFMNGRDIGLLLLIYVVGTILRGVIVALTYALLTACGHKLFWKDGVVATWGGLRGAVGLALGMMVYYDPLICKNVGDKVLFHTAGLVMLTVCVNGTTMSKVISMLGMNESTEAKQLMQQHGLNRLYKAGQTQEEALKRNSLFTSVVWHEAQRFYAGGKAFRRKKAAEAPPQMLGAAATPGSTLSPQPPSPGVNGGRNRVESRDRFEEDATTHLQPFSEATPEMSCAMRGKHTDDPGGSADPSGMAAAAGAAGGSPSKRRGITFASAENSSRNPSPAKGGAGGAGGAGGSKDGSPGEESRARPRPQTRSITRAATFVAKVAVNRNGRPFFERAPTVKVPTDSKEVRRRVLMICKQSYWNQFEQGLINRNAAVYLRTLCNLAMDRDCQLLEWSWIMGVLHIQLPTGAGEGSSAHGLAAHGRDSHHHDHRDSHHDHPDKVVRESTRSTRQAATRRQRILTAMDSMAWSCIVVVIALASCVVNLSEPDKVDGAEKILRLVVDYAVMLFFIVEVCVRCVCKQSFHVIIKDLFCVMDIFVVLLDIAATLVSSLLVLGGFDFSDYSTAPRMIRLIRLVRLVRLARIFRLANKYEQQKHMGTTKRPATDYVAAHKKAAERSRCGWVAKLSDGRWAQWATRRMEIAQYRFAYNVLSGFLFAREEAADVLQEFMEEVEVQGDVGPTMLRTFKAAFNKAIKAIHRDVAAVRGVLARLQCENFELHASLTTLIAARAVLNTQRKAVEKLYHEGMLEKLEADKISSRAQMMMKRLMRNPPIVQIPDLASMLRSVAWLRHLDDGQMALVLGTCVEQELRAKQVVLDQGDVVDEVIIVRRGTLALRCATVKSDDDSPSSSSSDSDDEKTEHSQKGAAAAAAAVAPAAEEATTSADGGGGGAAVEGSLSGLAKVESEPGVSFAQDGAPGSAALAKVEASASSSQSQGDVVVPRCSAVVRTESSKIHRQSSRRPRGDKEVAQLLMGDSFNEFSCVTGHASPYTIEASSASTIVRLPGQLVRDLTGASKEAAKELWLLAGTQAATHLLRQSMSHLAPWQLERVTRNLRASYLTAEKTITEVHFVPNATVVLVEGAATVITWDHTGPNTAKNWKPKRREDFQITAPALLLPPEGAGDRHFTAALAAGSRFVTDEDGVHKHFARRLSQVASFADLNRLDEGSEHAVADEKRRSSAFDTHVAATKSLDLIERSKSRALAMRRSSHESVLDDDDWGKEVKHEAPASGLLPLTSGHAPGGGERPPAAAPAAAAAPTAAGAASSSGAATEVETKAWLEDPDALDC